MDEFRIRQVEVRNPGHVLACLGALRLVTKMGVPAARGHFHATSAGELEFALNAVSGNCFLGLLRSLRVADEITLKQELELPEYDAIGGKETLRPVLLKGKWKPRDVDCGCQILLQGWLEPCSRYSGRFERKQQSVRKKSPLKFFAGKSTPATVLTPMIDSLRSATKYQPGDLLTVRSGGTAQFNFNAASTWNAHRRGFSPHEEGIDREVYPAVELLCAIAFDALPLKNLNIKEGFRYAPWWLPLSASDGTRAFQGHLPEPWVRERYRAPIHTNGQAKFLAYAELED